MWVTIEGLDLGRPNPIQQAFVDEGASQCGFCTPGFIISWAGHYLSQLSAESAAAGDADPVAAISGNICRCTGYHSILRAIEGVERRLRAGDDELAVAQVLPGWFPEIPKLLTKLLAQLRDRDPAAAIAPNAQLVGGGTDLFVQNPEAMRTAKMQLNLLRPELRRVFRDGDRVVAGGAV